MKEAEDNEQFSYIPTKFSKNMADDEENFDDVNEISVRFSKNKQHQYHLIYFCI